MSKTVAAGVESEHLNDVIIIMAAVLVLFNFIMLVPVEKSIQLCKTTKTNQ